MARDDDYPYVRAWGRRLGSHSYYIRDQVEQARRDGAPANAVHRNDDGSWMTTDDITSSDTRRQLGLEPLPPRPPEAEVILRELQTAVLWLPRLRGRIEYLYLVPCGESGDGVPCVFVYRGPHGDPDQDEPQHYYDLAGAWREKGG